MRNLFHRQNTVGNNVNVLGKKHDLMVGRVDEDIKMWECDKYCVCQLFGGVHLLKKKKKKNIKKNRSCILI